MRTTRGCRSTPFASAWKDEVLGPDRPDTDRSAVGVFTSFADYMRLPEPERSAIRFAMITHDEDGVPKFGWPIAIQEPGWIRHPRPGASTPVMRWRPFTTFAQVFVDMLNGSNVTPGVFASLGHDYRGDLLDFVSAIYRLPATLTGLEQALVEPMAIGLRAVRRDPQRTRMHVRPGGRRLHLERGRLPPVPEPPRAGARTTHARWVRTVQ